MHMQTNHSLQRLTSRMSPWRSVRWLLLLLSALGGLSVAMASTQAHPAEFGTNPRVQAFIRQLATKDHFDKQRLAQLFGQIKPEPAVIDAIERPAESLPWYKYRAIFMTQKRILEGAAFWRKHRHVLAKAEKVYGVPPQVITAIIGVESYYGQRMGHFPVLATLATLAFDYPPRGDFFRHQLLQFLLLTRQEHINPLHPKGSYAGAMGQGQFMPGTYRHYAVDFDGDGQRNLWNDPADAIGSIANYLARNGWQRRGFIAEPVKSHAHAVNLPEKLKPSLTPANLSAAGVKPAAHLPRGQAYSLIRLQGKHGTALWITGQNFYAITRYNISAVYAMAVYQLSEAIKHAYQHPAETAERAETHGS